MALTDDEASAAFRFLSNALREEGFAWVTNQVEEKLALGKVQAKKLRARESAEPSFSFGLVDERHRAPASKTTSAVFAVSEQFSPQEKLGVLLDGIDLAIPVVGEVAAEAFATLEEFGVRSPVQFAPEAEIADEFRVDAVAVRERMRAGSHLRGLIEELRSEIVHAA